VLKIVYRYDSPNADAIGTGDYSGKGRVITVLDGIKNKVCAGTKVLFTEGCSLTGYSLEGFNKAVEVAKQADIVVLALGGASLEPGERIKNAMEGGKVTCGEGADRDDLTLPGLQDELAKAVFKTRKPVVVVLLNGRPLSIAWIADNIPAILEERSQKVATYVPVDTTPVAIRAQKRQLRLEIYAQKQYEGGKLTGWF
jgi:hypothetical protein